MFSVGLSVVQGFEAVSAGCSKFQERGENECPCKSCATKQTLFQKNCPCDHMIFQSTTVPLA